MELELAAAAAADAAAAEAALLLEAERGGQSLPAVGTGLSGDTEAAGPGDRQCLPLRFCRRSTKD